MDTERWDIARADAWYRELPWLVGANYLPATAANSLEMWQAATFDPATIERELGWAAELGMNTARVFLHHLLWEDDRDGLLARIDRYLAIAASRGIRTMLTLFDSCFDPEPRLGPQSILPGVHNSAWVRCPGRKRLADSSRYPELEAYARGIVRAFASDERVLVWDVWNEPTPVAEPPDAGAVTASDLEDAAHTERLLSRAFDWVRESRPSQPLTSAIFLPNDRPWTPERLYSVERIQLDRSDVISFHCYEGGDGFRRRARQLAVHDRPMLCTEWLARPASTVEEILPLARDLRIGMHNWGLVSGRTQTRFPYESLEDPYIDREPEPWFHDLLQPDGSPYRSAETALIRDLVTERNAG
jgi:hypothetical protein